MKQIKNWKILANGINTSDALNSLMNQKYETYDGIIAIQSEKTMRMIYKEQISDTSLTIPEVNNSWVILVPDTDEEEKNEKIRQLMKNSNCSGLTYAKIDNMTIYDIWSYVYNYLIDKDKAYRMLLYFFNEKIYKK